MASGNGAVCALAGLGVSAVWFFGALKQFKILKKIEYTPTSKIVAAAPGTCEVVGKAVRGAALLQSPFRQKPCVYYHTSLFYWSGSGKSRHRNTALDLQSREPFLLADDTGFIQVDATTLSDGSKAEVKPDDFETRMGYPADVRDALGISLTSALKSLFKPGQPSFDEKTRTAPLTASEKADPVLRFVSEKYPKLRGYSDRIELLETYVEEGDSIYIIGNARMPLDGEVALTPLVLGEKKGSVYYLTEGDETQARKKMSHNAYLGLAVAPILFGACGAFMAAYASGLSGLVLGVSFLIALLMYFWVGLIHLLEIYNGVVLLRNQIDAARSNLQALYQRRLDLIPQLVEVVKAARAYEAGVQEELVKMRADPTLAASKTFIALSENYPRLAADENFISLQKELATTEEWIAGSRGFVLDSITLYNARIQQFPQLLFAPLVGFKSMVMEVDGPVRA